jgi:lipoprotein NlpI
LAYGYYSRASAERLAGEFKAAVADDSRALEINPADADACFDRALAKYLTADWTGALQDFRQYCQRSQGGKEYPMLYIWLLRARLGGRDAASEDLASYLDQRGPASSGDWASKLGGHLLGKVSEADLLAAAPSPDAKTQNDHYCEAWFYAGMTKLLDGNKAAAGEDFRKCLATGLKTFFEYQFAQAELKALGPY